MDTVKSMENVVGMKGGDGETSYAHASLTCQLNTIQVIKPILEREICQHMSFDNLKGGDGVFRIADLGCATGINTLLVADTIVRAVQTSCSSHSIDVPEFQVYFADLPSNDFNSLLHSLPPHQQLADRAHKKGEDERGFADPPSTRSYFAAAVCGSFYKRLFPPKSLHFCHTSSSLHWLSQLRTIQVIKPLLEREIFQYMSSDNLKGGDGVFRIADLGCATGTNTLLVADTIVRAVQTTCSSHSIEVPEFQVYFADLPSNDFNSLLRSLPPHERLADRTHKEDEDESCFSQPPATRSYFAAVVSGTFYKRLFPPKSLHFCHTCSSLHWLSQVPDSVVDRNSPAWNGGAIYISRDEVGAAYLSQFRKDFSAFLAARAEEMVPGGCMFVSLTARKSADLKEQGAIGHISHYMEAAFEELIKEGVIEKDKVDSFNLPLFCPNVEELESIVKMEESFEIVESVKLFSGLPLHPISEVTKGDEEMFGRMVTNSYRAAFENLVRAQLDSDVLTNEFYLRIEKMATARCQEYLGHRGDQLVAFLVRK